MTMTTALILRAGLTPRQVTHREATILYENREALFPWTFGGE